MLVIKTNVYEWVDIKGKEEKIFKESFYTEAEKLSMKSFDANENTNLVELLTREYGGEGTWVINAKDKPIRMVIIGYFDSKGEYRFIAAFDGAEIYILQNGKTIDKIIV
jgi:hypothetical protein